MKRSYSELDIKCKVGGLILGLFELSFSPITGYFPCNALTPGLSILLGLLCSNKELVDKAICSVRLNFDQQPYAWEESEKY